jgi:aryl-alcohol dehydrogenase-like predicted oxidoreductase
MEERRLGASGLWLSAVTIGTMTFGNQADEPEAFAILDRAHAAGVRAIDTADVYPLGGGPARRGESERIVGRWLQRRGLRGQMVIATKVSGAMGEARHERGLGRRHVREAVEASLRRLGVEAIDLYQAHAFDPDTPVEETARAFDDLVRAGKIHHWGVSNWRAWQVARLLALCDRGGLTRPVSVQPRYNALYRAIEEELVPLSLAEGLGILPYNPLAGGMLTGRYRADEVVAPPGRFTLGYGAGDRYRDRYWRPAIRRAAAAIAAAARAAGMAPAAAALRWVLDQPGVTSAIVGASRAQQLDESLAGVALELPARVRRRLDGAWERLPRRREER